jgi:hypothetical protein
MHGSTCCSCGWGETVYEMLSITDLLFIPRRYINMEHHGGMLPTGENRRTRRKTCPSSLCDQTGSGAHPAFFTIGTGGLFHGEKRGRGVTLTTHPHLMPRSWMRSYTSYSPLRLHRCVVRPLCLFIPTGSDVNSGVLSDGRADWWSHKPPFYFL